MHFGETHPSFRHGSLEPNELSTLDSRSRRLYILSPKKILLQLRQTFIVQLVMRKGLADNLIGVDELSLKGNSSINPQSISLWFDLIRYGFVCYNLDLPLNLQVLNYHNSV